MRSKYHRREAPPPPPRGNGTRQVLIGLVLVVVGAAVALSAQWLVTNASSPGTKVAAGPSASPSAEPSLPASPDLSASTAPIASVSPTAAPSSSASPAPSPSPASVVLEAAMPKSVNGTALTTNSARNATSLGGDPSSRALNAAVTNLGKKSADLELADAFDSTQTLAVSILGFRVAGLDPAKLRTVILEVWLSANTPGVTSTSVSLSGTPATKVTYPDPGPSEFVFVRGDGVFVIVTADQALAANAVAAMPAAAPSPSGG